MKRLLSKQDARQYSVLQLLMDGRVLTAQQVSEITSIPIRTLSGDIQQLNTILAPSSIQTGHEGMHLEIAPDDSIRRICGDLLAMSQELTLLAYIFNHEGRHTEDIAEDLFISSSTLQRMFKNMQEVMIEDNITIDTTHHQIIGDESSITKLFYAYYLELGATLQEAIPSATYQVLLEIAKYAHTEYCLQDIFPTKHHLCVWMYIRCIRLQKEHWYSLSPIEVENNLQDWLEENPKVIEDFKKCFNFTLDKNILIDLLYPIVQPFYARNSQEVITVMKQNILNERLYKNIETLLQRVAKSMHISKKGTDILSVRLYNQLQFSSHPIFILYSKPQYFVKGFMKENAVIAAIIKRHVDAVFLQYSKEARQEIMYYLIIHWPALIHKIQLHATAITIGVLLDASAQHSQFIVDMISNSTKAKVVIIASDILHDTNHTIDVLVTNIPNANYPVSKTIYIDEYLGYNDYRNITVALQDIYRTKILLNINTDM